MTTSTEMEKEIDYSAPLLRHIKRILIEKDEIIEEKEKIVEEKNKMIIGLLSFRNLLLVILSIFIGLSILLILICIYLKCFFSVGFFSRADNSQAIL